MTDPLPTGIEVLDRKLDGGIPPGQLVVLSSPPASQSELFLYDLAAVRPSVYLTTERTESAVETALEAVGVDLNSVIIQTVGTEYPLEDATQVIEGLSPRSNCIVDPTGLLEQQDEIEYRTFLNRLKERTVETESIALLHCLEGRRVTSTRDVTEYLADVVFDLSRNVSGESVEYTLSVPKFRGGRALEETITLRLTADVSIDVSRTIA